MFVKCRAEGLERVAASSYANTHSLISKLTQIDGVDAVFAGEYFHEALIRLPKDAQAVLEELAHQDVKI